MSVFEVEFGQIFHQRYVTDRCSIMALRLFETWSGLCLMRFITSTTPKEAMFGKKYVDLRVSRSFLLLFLK